MPISGENPVPQAVAGSGAAYVLGMRNTPNALALLAQGQKQREHAAAQRAAAKQKQAEQLATNFRNDLKYNTKTGRFYQKQFDDLTADAPDVLAGFYKDEQAGKITPLERDRQIAAYKQKLETERIHGEEKQKFLDGQATRIQADHTRDFTAYTTALAHSLIGPDGKLLPATQHDPEAVATALDADASTYKEREVIAKTMHDVVPKVSQKVAHAGQVGGQHYADEVHGQLIRMKDGKPVLNADFTPQLNLDGGAAELLDQGAVKVLADAREATYNKQREEREAARLKDPSLPSLPKISRNGHLSMMFGPQAAYSQSHEEGLNPRPPQPRAAKVSRDEVLVTPAVGSQLSHYEQFGQQPNLMARALGAKPGSPTLVPNHYPTVGESFGSARQPFASVMVDNHQAEMVGQDGKPTHFPKADPNGKVPMQLVSRDYSLYLNGKRLGRTDPYQTPAEAYQHLLATIRNLSPADAHKAELRAEYRGALVDKVKTAGDGLGGKPVAIGTDVNGRPVYDNGTTEKLHSVIVPADQYTDAQLVRATGGKWHPRKPTAEQRAVIEALRQKGGRIVNPYSQPTAPPTPHPKADPLGFGTTSTPRPQADPLGFGTIGADKSGGMLSGSTGSPQPHQKSTGIDWDTRPQRPGFVPTKTGHKQAPADGRAGLY